MGWPAVARFGVLASITMVACGGGGTRSTSDGTLSNQALTPGERDLTASYWCSIRSGEYDYPAMPCVVRKVNGRYVLAKLAGSQRFRGEVRERADGLAFDGEFYCPWGDCSRPIHGVFKADGDGRLVGEFADNGIVVTMTRAQDHAFGGAGYAGVGYGGAQIPTP